MVARPPGMGRARRKGRNPAAPRSGGAAGPTQPGKRPGLREGRASLRRRGVIPQADKLTLYAYRLIPLGGNPVLHDGNLDREGRNLGLRRRKVVLRDGRTNRYAYRLTLRGDRIVLHERNLGREACKDGLRHRQVTLYHARRDLAAGYATL